MSSSSDFAWVCCKEDHSTWNVAKGNSKNHKAYSEIQEKIKWVPNIIFHSFIFKRWISNNCAPSQEPLQTLKDKGLERLNHSPLPITLDFAFWGLRISNCSCNNGLCMHRGLQKTCVVNLKDMFSILTKHQHDSSGPVRGSLLVTISSPQSGLPKQALCVSFYQPYSLGVLESDLLVKGSLCTRQKSKENCVAKLRDVCSFLLTLKWVI